MDETVKSLRDRYILPHDVEEILRMQNQHEWVKGCADGLIKAPLDMTKKNLRVLDAATADGTSYSATNLPSNKWAHRSELTMLLLTRLLDPGCAVHSAQGNGVCGV
jgi:hypothetical protein